MFASKGGAPGRSGWLALSKEVPMQAFRHLYSHLAAQVSNGLSKLDCRGRALADVAGFEQEGVQPALCLVPEVSPGC